MNISIRTFEHFSKWLSRVRTRNNAGHQFQPVRRSRVRIEVGLQAILAICLIAGCSPEPSEVPQPESNELKTSENLPGNSRPGATGNPESVSVVEQISDELPPIPQISLGPSSSEANTASSDGQEMIAAQSGSPSRRAIINALKPVQVMLGQWRGTTQKQFGDFKALDTPEWVWDFQTDPEHPSLVMTSKESPYFRTARLTYAPDEEIFGLETTDPEGRTRLYDGNFSKPVEEFQGDDRTMQVRYQLQFQQTNGESPRDTWQVTFNQQKNNRYLVELARLSGKNFLRFDTIATQRDGTSFAMTDEGYGDRECIISGGLGTISLTHNGKTYWVCCTGCRAAFLEDPEQWIAENTANKSSE
ncbi:YHS domain protein [Thalassoglobus neptunius]|uniref:YHS domain protein n=1 Tax=Thalassoglobus neptunius TaxID=1938619 RepID=A0A5C5VWU2_9PLAN|nr:hypothetical protein [Thalassoglobus neptunius]TWT43088.1 YHS domain protein [Thalassoglobus neptunius]